MKIYFGFVKNFTIEPYFSFSKGGDILDRSLHNQRGFTLMEVVVVTSISTLLMLVITFSIVSIYRNNAYALAQTGEIDNARRGLQTWTQDAREMDFGANGAYAIQYAGPHYLSFYSDIDPDAVTEFIEYELINTTLYRRVHKAGGFPATYSTSTPSTFTLSEYVQNNIEAIPTFRYYNNSGEEIANPNAQITDIRYIRMQLVVNIDPIRAPGEFVLEGSATPRNLKDNL
jgi:prepilin-type N-terminal cleavage/methylation domain-containing protein